MTTTDAVTHYRRKSWRRLSQVDAELDRGEISAASQALWDAAECAIKAAAERRGWPHETFADLEDVIDRLANDERAGCQMLGERRGSFHLIGQYMLAVAFGQFHDDVLPSAGKIRYGKKRVGELIYSLETPFIPTISDLAPSPSADADLILYHQRQAWSRLEQVDYEINIGLGEHARDSLWAATIHAIKAAALRRNRPSETAQDLNATVDKMVFEEGLSSRAFQLYMIAVNQSREGWQTPQRYGQHRLPESGYRRVRRYG